MLTEVSFEQFSKVAFSILFTALGILIEVRLEQPSNAPHPMFVTVSGILIEERFRQPENALAPMFVTVSGIFIKAIPEQPLKASFPILVTVTGMSVLLQPAINEFVSVSIIALQLFLLSYFLFPFSTTIDWNPEQPPKAASPILVSV